MIGKDALPPQRQVCEPSRPCQSRPSRHRFSLLTILVGIECLIQARSTLRSMVLILGIIHFRLEAPVTAPSHETIRLWLLRVGLYVLNRPVEPADDWIWITDHSAPVGPDKCFLVLGVRHSALQAADWTLAHHDVQVLHLEVVSHSTGELVAKQLRELAGRIGRPRQVVSDHGADLIKGMRLFRQDHPEVIDTYDISHKLACLLKAELSNDDRWKTFLEKCKHARRRLQQTPASSWMPPETRVKARYMNYHRQTAWAERHLELLAGPVDTQLAGRLGLSCEQTRAWLEERLGWLVEFHEEIALYEGMMRVVRAAQIVVKQQGLWRDSHERFDRELPTELPEHPRLTALIERIREFLTDEGAKLPEGQGFLGSSDIIESLFGKHKQFAERSSHKGLGPNLLLLPLLTVKLAPELVGEALATTPGVDIAHWRDREFGKESSARQEIPPAQTVAQNKHEEKSPNTTAI